jgi:beta-lysine 5,6-aminomutase beta subunit
MSQVAQVDLHQLKPYGDAMNDGIVQLSFTLPVAASPESEEAARLLASQMGLDEVKVVSMEEIGPNFSFYVLYGKCLHSIDMASLEVPKAQYVPMDRTEVDRFHAGHFTEPITVVGACIGADAHTVGIDAILNMKGFAGHYGLERYRAFRVVNMGAQIPPEVLVGRAIQEKAQAILVSQIVTQKDIHLRNLNQLADLLEAEGLRDEIVLIVGGPSLTHHLAIELGYDAGFGRGTVPEQVAAFVVQELARRQAAVAA